jgi:hypothetical protein
MADKTENYTQVPGVPGASRQNLIPENVRGLINSTSNADECFINQRFSGKMQAFLVGYVSNITSGYGVSATTLHR